MKPSPPVDYAAAQREIERAVALIGSGRSGQAVRTLRDLVQKHPDLFDAVHVLGSACVLDGRLEDGIRHLRKASELKPDAKAVWVNLGGAYERAGRLEEAVDAFAKALEVTPDLAEANYKRTLVLLALGRIEEASKQAEGFAERYWANDTANIAAGIVRMRQGRFDDAVMSFRRAVERAPHNALARANLGFALGASGRYLEAAAELSDVVTRQPDDHAAREKLIVARRAIAHWNGLLAHETALLRAIEGGEAAEVDPFALLYMTDRPDILRRAATARVGAVVPRLPTPLRAEGGYDHERLRIAYLSGDFRAHPVARMVADLVEAHDRSRFEVFGVAYGNDDGSPIRTRLAQAFEHFVDHGSAAPDVIARDLRAREIDIVIDLSGPTEAGQPLILAHRPAPVQVSYLGFPSTTGATWMDYAIADATTVPPGAERGFTEKVVRLPGSYLPPARRSSDADARPTRAAAGLPEDGIVFACFCLTQKISPGVFAAWMNLLKGVEGSVLWLRSDDADATANLKAAAARADVDEKRVVIAPRVDSDAEHISRLGLADVFLDTFPYGGHTTVADALWAGVPVVTLAGECFASRVGASQLAVAGLHELVTKDLGAYESVARALAGDGARRAAIKTKLEQARASGPLFDAAAYARKIEKAYLLMHERARKGGQPAAMDLA